MFRSMLNGAIFLGIVGALLILSWSLRGYL